jgi:hypothetical protein
MTVIQIIDRCTGMISIDIDDRSDVIQVVDG